MSQRDAIFIVVIIAATTTTAANAVFQVIAMTRGLSLARRGNTVKMRLTIIIVMAATGIFIVARLKVVERVIFDLCGLATADALLAIMEPIVIMTFH